MRRSSGGPPKASSAGAVSPLHFAERTPYPENDLVNARWYPAPAHKDPARPKQAIVVMPQWNPMASATTRCARSLIAWAFRRCGSPCPITNSPARRAERSDYAVSANIGRTISACRQAVVDIRCCLDWLEEQGYEHFGVLGTSLGSCYAYLASAHDARLRVNAFNHASTAFGDVVWAGQSTRHIRQAVEEAGLTQERVRVCGLRQPSQLLRQIRRPEANGAGKNVLVVYANYDLTFPGVFAAGGRGLSPYGSPRVARAALRPLHHRRNAL